MYYIHHTNSHVFHTIAKVIAHELNYNCKITTDLTKKDGIWILFFDSFNNRVHKKISGPYIAVQTEPLHVQGTPEYLEYLSKALTVWDYTTNFKIGYSKIWECEFQQSKPIDVLFYGGINDRRMSVLSKINNIEIVGPPNFTYGSQLWNDYISNSKIILSLAYYEPSNNDLFRIAPLLSNRCFVIAEKCNDEEFNNNPNILTCDKDDIPQLCEYYLNNPLERLEWIDKGYEYIKNNPIKIPYLPNKDIHFEENKINFNTKDIKKMKITQVTPGLIPVPPNGWGAVEKIIWNYKLNFEEMGHECDVTYLNYVDANSDIIHIHVANLAIEAKERGIPYIFSLHDHHVVRHGKNSGTYWENLEAIKGSIISFTHAEFLVDYFDETDKLFYLSHGVDTEYFSYTPKEVTEHKLLCVANNGYRDNQSYDRKGFRFAIEAAKELGLPITIVGPKNNENFFNVNEDLLDYDRLTILSHNATEEELLQILKEHTIFLHPSELEAGHPNLTILESLSCGIPVVGTYNGSNELKGLKRIERSTESVVDGIIDVMLKYDEYVKNTQQDKLKYDWSVISKRLLKMYESVTLIKKEYSSDITKGLYIDSINSTEKNHIEPKEHVKFITHFVNGPFLEIQNNLDKEYYVEFIATDGSVVYSTKLRSNMWTRANRQYYEDWTINVYLDNEIVYTEKLNLKGSRVYIAIDSSALGDNLAWVPYIDEFRKKHNCHVICSTFKNDLFESQYPDIEFVNPGSEVKNILAMYMLGWFYDLNKEPTKPNIPSLQEHACNILGLDFTEIRPKLNMDISYRPISEKYITIGPTTTLGCKEWSYPNGWQELVDYLNGLGYKVAVITKEQTPWLNNVLDWTGDHPLQTRINQLYHSEFYIGLGSGLSWLSWSVGKPTVMIANFSKEGHEFTSNCIRITNKSVCNGCWNNPNFTFDKGDWYWCPVNKGTEDQFICQKSITPQMVIEQISHLL